MTDAGLAAGLASTDERKIYRPRRAEALPELNTATWKAPPDGAMETVLRLRPNLVWHDGAALSADDWVFSFRVIATPELGAANSLPQRFISDVHAPDDRTMVFKWSAPPQCAHRRPRSGRCLQHPRVDPAMRSEAEKAIRPEARNQPNRFGSSL